MIFSLTIVLGTFLFIMGLGAFVQHHHLKDLDMLEKEYAYLPMNNHNKPLRGGFRPKYIEVISASCVIGPSAYNLLMRIPKMIFGGEVADYAKVAQRARREALIRLKKKAHDADEIINVKIDTVPMHVTDSNEEPVYAIGVLAYGTALYY